MRDAVAAAEEEAEESAGEGGAEGWVKGGVQLGLYKIVSSFEWFVHESIVLSFFRPACIAPTAAILLHDYWAVSRPPLDLPCVFHAPSNIGNNNIV